MQVNLDLAESVVQETTRQRLGARLCGGKEEQVEIHRGRVWS